MDEDYKNSRGNIPWRKINGLRNPIVHDYDGVNFSLIWDIVKNDMPDFWKNCGMRMTERALNESARFYRIAGIKC
jgi:uncharacterized protein with HEPN domain